MFYNYQRGVGGVEWYGLVAQCDAQHAIYFLLERQTVHFILDKVCPLWYLYIKDGKGGDKECKHGLTTDGEG